MDLYIDLNKGLANTAHLVKKPVQVHGKGGKTFTRMQWVDPNDNAPVMESHHHEEDPHLNRIKGMKDEDKAKVAQKYISGNTDRAHKFAMATGMRRNPAYLPPLSVVNHVKDNLHRIPQEHIEDHLKEDNVIHPKMALKHTDHGLPEEEVSKRTGEKGSLDKSKLTEGTLVQDDPSFDVMWDEIGMDIKDGKKVFSSIFKGITRQGLEHAFSHPDGQFTAKMIDLQMAKGKDGIAKPMVGFRLYDEDGESMGAVDRTVWRGEDGVLNVRNDELTLKSSHQGAGVSDTLYDRTEQLWRHMSEGNPVNIHMKANISVGVYAWAKKGFDFSSPEELDKAKKEFKDFLSENGMDLKETLEKCGKSSLDDLNHAWDFATLHDGNSYNLKGLMGDTRVKYKGEVKGEGHLGKAFMLGGKSSWKAVKKLNQGEIHEDVEDIHKRAGGK
jgi:hypothetical protein